jgi:hypothetical protein
MNEMPAAPKKARRWVPWAAGVGAFVVGIGLGASSAGSATVTATKTVTQTTTATATKTETPPPVVQTVTKEVTPQVCLDALTYAGTLFGVAAKYPPLITKAAQAGYDHDPVGLRYVLTQEKLAGAKLHATGPKFVAAVKACKAKS